MSAQVGLTVTAGALVLTADLLDGTWDNAKAVKTVVATVLAAYVGAGLDNVMPGFGTGLAVLLVLGVAYKDGPSIMTKILGKG